MRPWYLVLLLRGYKQLRVALQSHLHSVRPLPPESDSQVWAQRGLPVSPVTEPAGCSREAEAGASEPERREAEAEVLGSRLPYLQAGPDGWAPNVTLGGLLGAGGSSQQEGPKRVAAGTGRGQLCRGCSRWEPGGCAGEEGRTAGCILGRGATKETGGNKTDRQREAERRVGGGCFKCQEKWHWTWRERWDATAGWVGAVLSSSW